MEKSYNSYIWQSSTGYRDNHKSKKWLNQDSLISLYYSFIYPYFIYCNRVWGTTYKTYIEPLTVLQKKIIRIIAGVKPRTSAGSLFDQCKCLKCIKINRYLIGRLMLNIHNDETHMLKAFFKKNSEIHEHETKQKYHYLIPSFKTNLGKTVWDTQVQFSGMKF